MAKDYQKTRSGLVAINRDQNIVSAGDLSKTKQDVSLWSGKGGLVHNKGWAVCDGSTYDPLVFPELDAALGNPVSKVVPNGPYKTRSIDQTESIITFSNTPTNWDLRGLEGYAYSDNSGQWFLYITLSAIFDSISSFTFNIDGIVSKQSSLFTYFPGTTFGGNVPSKETVMLLMLHLIAQALH